MYYWKPKCTVDKREDCNCFTPDQAEWKRGWEHEQICHVLEARENKHMKLGAKIDVNRSFHYMLSCSVCLFNVGCISYCRAVTCQQPTCHHCTSPTSSATKPMTLHAPTPGPIHVGPSSRITIRIYNVHFPLRTRSLSTCEANKIAMQGMQCILANHRCGLKNSIPTLLLDPLNHQHICISTQRHQKYQLFEGVPTQWARQHGNTCSGAYILEKNYALKRRDIEMIGISSSFLWVVDNIEGDNCKQSFRRSLRRLSKRNRIFHHFVTPRDERNFGCKKNNWCNHVWQ